jgi:DNA-binding transcriptional LysR family regulator
MLGAAAHDCKCILVIGSITRVHLDLNLLVALDALLDERSVGAAAGRLHLSQPAMSRTLGRIRHATGDEILVRSGRTMLPTPYAEQIRGDVHHLVAQAQAIFMPTAEIDPATLSRTFTVQCNDVVAGALVPRLAARVAATAPGVRLRFLGESEADTDELRRGNADLQLTDQTGHPADVRSMTVLTDRVVTIARRDLPVDPATTDGFVALPHVVISRRGRRRNLIDDLLAEQGHRRRVAVTVPTVAMALRAVAVADLITTAPARLTADQLGPALRSFPLPMPAPPIPAVLAWHARHEKDSAHRWLRGMITEVLTTEGASMMEKP